MENCEGQIQLARWKIAGLYILSYVLAVTATCLFGMISSGDWDFEMILAGLIYFPLGLAFMFGEAAATVLAWPAFALYPLLAIIGTVRKSKRIMIVFALFLIANAGGCAWMMQDGLF